MTLNVLSSLTHDHDLYDENHSIPSAREGAFYQGATQST